MNEATSFNWARFVIALSIVIAAIGLLVGLLPIRADGDPSVSCGSAFSPDTKQAESADLRGTYRDIFIGLKVDPTSHPLADQCLSKADARSTLAEILIGLGIAGVVAAAWASASRRSKENNPEDTAKRPPLPKE